MGCAKKRYRSTQSVWCDGVLNNPIYLLFFRLSTSDWAKARVSLLMEGSSGELTVSSAAMYGDEEVDFATATASDFAGPTTVIDTDQAAWGASFASFDTTRQLVDIGVKVKNNSANGKLEAARVTLIVDVSEA